MTAQASTPALIGLDWGTTSLRAYLFAADGSVLDTRALAAGAHAALGRIDTHVSWCAKAGLAD